MDDHVELKTQSFVTNRSVLLTDQIAGPLNDSLIADAAGLTKFGKDFLYLVGVVDASLSARLLEHLDDLLDDLALTIWA